MGKEELLGRGRGRPGVRRGGSEVLGLELGWSML